MSSSSGVGGLKTASKRLQKEYEGLLSEMKTVLRGLSYDETNFFVWTGYMVLTDPPYNKGAFKIEITFPAEYPFKPPKITFKTYIYHPNIDEKGQICLPIINPENWKPATKIRSVIESLIQIITVPELDHALRSDLADEYKHDNKRFMKTAEEYTRQHAEAIPNL